MLRAYSRSAHQMVVLASLIRIVISGFDRRLQLSQTSRIIRIVGGGLWAAMILAGMVVQNIKAFH